MTSPAPDTGRTAEENEVDRLRKENAWLTEAVNVARATTRDLHRRTQRAERFRDRWKSWSWMFTKRVDVGRRARRAENNLIALAKTYGEACRDLVYARSGEDDLFWQKEEAIVALSRKLVTAETEAAHLRAENANLRDRVREAEEAGRDPDGSGHPAEPEPASGLGPSDGCPSRGQVLMRLPRLDRSMIQAACHAHYGSDNIVGIDLTVRGINHSFEAGFRRMWSGVRNELKRRATRANDERAQRENAKRSSPKDASVVGEAEAPHPLSPEPQEAGDHEPR